MKCIKTKVGSIFTWYDFVKPRKDNSTGIITYSQSNTAIDGYSQRYIGLYMNHNSDIYIAVAVNKKNDNGNWWRFILENRIASLIAAGNNIGENDKGISFVPLKYKDLLYNDPYAYLNLYGMIDPTYLDMAVKEATMNNTRLIESYVTARSKT